MLPVLVAKLHRNVVTVGIGYGSRGSKNFDSYRHRLKVAEHLSFLNKAGLKRCRQYR